MSGPFFLGKRQKILNSIVKNEPDHSRLKYGVSNYSTGGRK